MTAVQNTEAFGIESDAPGVSLDMDIVSPIVPAEIEGITATGQAARERASRGDCRDTGRVVGVGTQCDASQIAIVNSLNRDRIGVTGYVDIASIKGDEA